MSEIVETTATEIVNLEEPKTEFSIEIKISNKNLQYRSDFTESETIFWLEAVKTLILKNAFDTPDSQ